LIASLLEHFRRKFFDLGDTSPVATEVLRRIAVLYAITGRFQRRHAAARR
jgi:hypothetical protein